MIYIILLFQNIIFSGCQNHDFKRHMNYSFDFWQNYPLVVTVSLSLWNHLFISTTQYVPLRRKYNITYLLLELVKKRILGVIVQFLFFKKIWMSFRGTNYQTNTYSKSTNKLVNVSKEVLYKKE